MTLGTCYLACYVPLDIGNMGGYGLWVQNGKGEKQWGGGSTDILVLIKISTM
jgi:hypothetical protein